MTKDRREHLLILLASFVVVFVRSPLLLLHGRVVAEEGTDYLQRAWQLGARSLFSLTTGYYSLLVNGVAFLIAKWLPLEWAGNVYTTGALLILLLTVYLAITCELFTTTRTRVLAAAVCLFTPAIDVWLTLEVCQFYLAVCVAFICLSSEQRHRIVRLSTLLLAGLTGPISCFFAPVTLWRAYRRRTAAAYWQAAILNTCALLQAAFLLHSIHTGERRYASPDKFVWFGPMVFMKIFSVTFFTRLGAFLTQRIVIHHPNLAVCALLWLLTLPMLALFWRIARNGGEAGRLCFFMAIYALVMNYLGCAEPIETVFIGTFRYFFVGFVLLWMLPLIAYARTENQADSASRKLSIAVLCIALFCGFVDSVGYWSRLQKTNVPWREEVAAWRKDPHHGLRVSPATWPFTVHLDPKS